MKPDNNGVPQFTLPEPSSNSLTGVNTPVQTVPIGNSTSTEDAHDAFTELSINRAKSIVSQTANDPYIQAEQLNKLKAEYIKQRFNIDIKLAQ